MMMMMIYNADNDDEEGEDEDGMRFTDANRTTSFLQPYSIFHSKNTIPEDLDDTQKLLRSIRHPRLTHNHVHHRMKEQDSVFLIIGYLLNGEKSSVS